MIGFYYCCSILTTSKYSLLEEVLSYLLSYQHAKSTLANGYVHWLYLIQVFVTKMYVYLLTVSATVIVIVHTAFVLTNSTTFECSKGSKYIDYLQNSGIDVMDFPFSNGILYNLYHFFCIRNTIIKTTSSLPSLDIEQQQEQQQQQQKWIPIMWERPSKRTNLNNSTDWYNNPWRNKYWSCC